MAQRIAFVTYTGLPVLADDDRLAAEQLAAHDVDVVAVSWDDPSVDWTAFDLIVLRSCWDYHLRVSEFTAWLDHLEQSRAPVWNPVRVVRSNLDKRYLRALASRGVPVVPTRWCEARDGPSLGDVLAEAGWACAVVKPTVSSSSHETRRVTQSTVDREERWFRGRLALGAMMVQPHIAEIETAGEWSCCFIGGAYSHGVRKLPRRGDFRVQSAHGGTWHAAEPPRDVIDNAARVLAQVRDPLLYARVDGVVRDGRFELMELELIEPSLFLDCAVGASRLLAEAVLKRCAAAASPLFATGPNGTGSRATT